MFFHLVWTCYFGGVAQSTFVTPFSLQGIGLRREKYFWESLNREEEKELWWKQEKVKEVKGKWQTIQLLVLKKRGAWGVTERWEAWKLMPIITRIFTTNSHWALKSLSWLSLCVNQIIKSIRLRFARNFTIPPLWIYGNISLTCFSLRNEQVEVKGWMDGPGNRNSKVNWKDKPINMWEDSKSEEPWSTTKTTLGCLDGHIFCLGNPFPGHQRDDSSESSNTAKSWGCF